MCIDQKNHMSYFFLFQQKLFNINPHQHRSNQINQQVSTGVSFANQYQLLVNQQQGQPQQVHHQQSHQHQSHQPHLSHYTVS